MNCDETTELLTDRLKGLLSARDEQRLEDHLESCPACREEAVAVEALWAEMGQADASVPHERMRARFHAALAAYEERSRASGFERLAAWLTPMRPVLQFGLAAAVLAVGIGIGRGFTGAGDEIDALRGDVQAMGIALLNHQSASGRLLGVEWSARNASYSPVTDALLDVVRSDDNVNVRLAAIEAISQQTDRPEVAAALLAALEQDASPLLQVTLIALVLEREVAGSVEAVERLLENDNLDPAVREFASMALSELGPSASTDIA